MSLPHIILLAIVQGFAELLPISSSAHVVVVEKLLGLDPSSPPMTLLLVMLHTGTMVAVIVYFWRPWRALYLDSIAGCKRFAGRLAVATALTALVGEALIVLIEKTFLRGTPHAQVEDLFGHLELIAPALAATGVLIWIASAVVNRARELPAADDVSLKQAGIIGAVQGLCLPFRGFSRSGATISAGMLLGVNRARAEVFSFALAVLLTPPAVAREALRLIQAERASGSADLAAIGARSVLGALIAFVAGLIALRWLSRWLEAGRWYLFGVYCLLAAMGVAALHHVGY